MMKILNFSPSSKGINDRIIWSIIRIKK